MTEHGDHVIGLLLAAGSGTRYRSAHRGSAQGTRAGARSSKLLVPLPASGIAEDRAGQAVAVAAARALVAGVGPVLAVVRQEDIDLEGSALHALLRAEGCEILSLPGNDAAAGMGNSLAAGVRASATARGWVVALADMPAIRVATIRAVCEAIEGGARIAAPYFQGQRGHPVGFAASCLQELVHLEGDEGARSILAREPPLRLDVDDRGILFDVDAPADLARIAGAPPKAS